MTEQAHDKTGAGGRHFGRLLLRVAWVSLTVWSACLWVVGAGELGRSWAGMVEAASAELIALAAALVMPNYLLHKVLLLTVRAHPAEALAVRMALASPSVLAAVAGRARWQLRLLAVAAALAAVGGLATTAGGGLAVGLLRALGEMFLWPQWLWSLLRLGVRVVAFLPLALGMAAVTLAGSLIRRAGSSDPYRHVTGELLVAAGGGLAASAGLWWLGADLRAVALVCAVALAAVSAGALIHGTATGRTYRPSVPATTAPLRGQRRWNLLAMAALSCGLAVQCRALRDAAGCGWAGPWLWIAFSAGIAVAMTRQRSGQEGSFDRAETGALVAGATVVGAMQVCLLALAGASPAGRWVWIALAAAGQAVFVGLWSMLLTRRRLAFARSGHPQRYWLADAALGCGFGAMGGGAMLSAGGAFLPALVALGGVTAVFLMPVGSGGRTRAGPGGAPGRQLRWAATGSAAIVGMALMWAGLGRAAGKALGAAVAVGASLTVVQGLDGAAVLPRGTVGGAGGETARLAGRVIGLHPGRWRIVSMAPPPPDADAAAGVRVEFRPPDRAVARLPGRPAPPGWTPPGGQQDVVSAGLDGVYIDALPIDHPDAWGFYSVQAMRDARRRLGRGGLLLVRAIGGADDLPKLVAVAEGFHRAAGDGTAVVVLDGSRAEVLLIAGAGEELGPLPWAGGGSGEMYVVGLRKLLGRVGVCRPISATAPGRRAGPALDRAELARRLAGAGR